jgi:hypothetical protein
MPDSRLGFPSHFSEGADTKLLRPSASISETLFKDICLYFLALASEYDGTLARDGRVDAATLRRWSASKQPAADLSS